jgi:hypothetical protein
MAMTGTMAEFQYQGIAVWGFGHSLQEVGCCVARRRRYEQRFQNALEANGS